MKVGQPVRTVGASLTHELYERLLAHVAQVGGTRSSVVRQAIAQYLKHPEPPRETDD
jgi:predicted DNA-binding protein